MFCFVLNTPATKKISSFLILHFDIFKGDLALYKLSFDVDAVGDKSYASFSNTGYFKVKRTKKNFRVMSTGI